jgi:hypothetical protein
MPQRISTSCRALVEAAEREIETITVDEARVLYGGADVVFVDIRDIRELEHVSVICTHSLHAGSSWRTRKR